MHFHELLYIKNLHTSKTKFLQLFVTLLFRHCFYCITVCSFGCHFKIMRKFENNSLTIFNSIFSILRCFYGSLGSANNFICQIYNLRGEWNNSRIRECFEGNGKQYWGKLDNTENMKKSIKTTRLPAALGELRGVLLLMTC